MNSHFNSTASELNKVPQLSNDAAGKLLANVFDSCEMEPSDLSLELLSSYTQYRRERYKLQKEIIMFIFAIFLILPIFFVSPSVKISYVEEQDITPYYMVETKSFLVPVSRVSAMVNGNAVSVYENGERSYRVTPTENGELTVRVTLSNRQYSVVTMKVEKIDTDAPIFLSSDKKDDKLYVYVSESESGLDSNNCVAYTSSGDELKPAEVNLEEQYVAFDFPTESVNIFISDKAANTLQLVVTIGDF